MSAKVALVRCEDYDSAKVESSVRRAVELLGGLGGLIKPGSRVLLKPNLLSARLPEEGVDTHPEVVKAAARLAKEAGGLIWVGDSPGGYGKNMDEIFEKSGMRKAASEEGVELVKFNSSRSVNGLPVSRYLLDADAVISIPKFKTHGITTITAGVKNMFGAITGMFKAGCHSRAPKEGDFVKILAEVYSVAKPGLTILDAVVSMEGDGPASGTLRNTGFILASLDAVALDAVAAKMIGLDPLAVASTRSCYERGLGEADLAKIEIVGDDIGSFSLSDFKLPQTKAKVLKIIPKAVANSVASLVKFRPVIDEEACKRCNLCKLSCPVDCITIERDRCEIDYKKCINCLCCHEVCPYRAVYIKRSMLAKVVWG